MVANSSNIFVDSGILVNSGQFPAIFRYSGPLSGRFQLGLRAVKDEVPNMKPISHLFQFPTNFDSPLEALVG